MPEDNYYRQSSQSDSVAYRQSSQRSMYSTPGSTRGYNSRSSTPATSTNAAGPATPMPPQRNDTLPGTQPRYSSSSGGRPSTSGGGGVPGSSGSRRQINLSSIEKSVTHLLVATKQLLETLTAWSRGTATEAEVSDVYVRLGSEFNNACRSFMAIGVETSDLGNVPDELRTILESTLSQDASQESLEVYLPRIREIIINLLHGLKKKQAKLRQRQQRESEGSSSSGSRSSGERTASGRIASSARVAMPEMPPMPEDAEAPARNQSVNHRGSPPTSQYGRSNTPSQEGRLPRQRQGSGAPLPQQLHSGPSENAAPAGASPPPPPPPPAAAAAAELSDGDPAHARFIASSPPPPPPPPPAQDALAALQRENALERRASRRYSMYQSQTIAKLTGTSASDVQMIPSGGRTARKRESKDSADAIRMRQSMRAKPKPEPSPSRNINRISEGAEAAAAAAATAAAVPTPAAEAKPEEKTPEEAKSLPNGTGSSEVPTVKVNADASPPHTPQSLDGAPGSPIHRSKKPASRSPSPASQKEMTIFLQVGRSIKKHVISSEEIEDLSLNSLRLLFISKFTYSPPAGENFPEIYLQDPKSGVRYELEDLNDIKDSAIICLNVEVLDEVKRHIDDGIGELKKMVEGMKGHFESQSQEIKKISEAQKETASKIASLSIAAAPASPPPTSRSKFTPFSSTSSDAHVKEIEGLRKELSELRAKYAAFVEEANSSLSTIKNAKDSTAGGVASGNVPLSQGRQYVEAGKKQLSADSDNLVTRVDDLQDIIEDLRKDVVSRGVRPLPRKLDGVSKEIAQARTELKKMQDYIRTQKPVWKKVWERELETVCEDQQFCNMQEELVADLQDDLDKAATTFNLVEQCTASQTKSPTPSGPRFLRERDIDEIVDPNEVKGNVLSEVRGLKPNHQSRVEAIERAEKMRQKELESRVPAFQRELGEFVKEGRLNSKGGVEEAERIRAQRDEEARKAAWEMKQAAMKKEKEGEGEAGEAGEGEGEGEGGGGVAVNGDGAKEE